MLDWTGKNVVYVGSFSGIGWQMMMQLMQQDIKMMGIMHRMENVEMMKKLQAVNPSVKVMFMQMNLMDKMSIDQAMKKMGQMMGHFDVMINAEHVLLDKDVEMTMGMNLVRRQLKYSLFSALFIF